VAIPHALLALLAEGPKFGLRLKEEFEQRTGSVWPLNVGQVYTTLGRLERDGLVVVADEEGDSASQTLYRLTNDGGVELRSWLSTAGVDKAPHRDEVVIKVMVALSVPGIDPLDVVQSHRRQAIESMRSFTRLKSSGDDLALALVADAQLFRLEATVRWLDSCEARIARGDQLKPHLAQERPEIGVEPATGGSVDVAGVTR